MLLSPLLALGFVSLPMLGWLVLAALPLLIHLLYRRRHREQRWAAMRYLAAAVRRHRHRFLLKQWLLLVLRTLVIVLVVVAMAEPVLQRADSLGIGGARTLRVLILDGSYSMAYRPDAGARSLLDEAKSIATSLVERAPTGDEFALLVMADPPRTIIATPALHREDVVAEIDRVRQTHTGADLPGTLRVAAELIERRRGDASGPRRAAVHVISDLQRITWLPDEAPAARATLKRAVDAFNRDVQLELTDVGPAERDNVALVALAVADGLVTTAGPVEFVASLRNFGETARMGQAVECLVNRRPVAEHAVDLPAGESDGATGDETRQVRFTHRFENDGDHAVEVRATGDNLAIDNRRYLAVSVRRRIRVLCVDGRPRLAGSGRPLPDQGGQPVARAIDGAAGYLINALEPNPAGGGLPIDAELASERALLQRDLSRYQAVFTCDVARWTEGEAAALRRYVGQGGSLIVFLGGQVDAESYNRRLAAPGPDRPALLPARLGKPIAMGDTPPPPADGAVTARGDNSAASPADTPARIDPLGNRHPILGVFRGAPGAGLASVPVTRAITLTPIETRNDAGPGEPRIVLGVGDGASPLMIEHAFGRGRVVLVGTSADPEWTALPLMPAYVPLIQETLRFCLAEEDSDQTSLVGRPLSGMFRTTGDPFVLVTLPDGRQERLSIDGTGRRRRWTEDEPLLAGFYSVEFGPPDATTLRAVNVDTRESDLAAAGPRALLEVLGDRWRVIGRSAPGSLDRRSTTEPATPRDATPTRTSPLAMLLLSAALVTMITETLLASRMDRRDS